jgi:transcriptional pleiotropic regulator of transition state genes
MSSYKKISSHGSINIPVAMRRDMGIQGGDPMEVSSEGGAVVVRPYRPRCIFCGTDDDTKIRRLSGRFVCGDCAEEAALLFGTAKENSKEERS